MKIIPADSTANMLQYQTLFMRGSRPARRDRRRSILNLLSVLSSLDPRCELQRDQARDQDGREELSHQSFDHRETARDGKHWSDVAVADGGQRHEAVVNEHEAVPVSIRKTERV